MTDDVQIGTANLDARGGKEFNHFSLENGPTQLYRVLPPLHNLAADGSWFIYKPSHWTEGSPKPGKDKGQKRQFVCPLKKDKNKMVVNPCPRCTEVETLKGQLKLLEDQGLTKTDARVAMLSQRIFSLSRGSYYYVNAINIATGKMGDLKLPYSSFTLLEAEIKKYQSEKKKDALGVEEGVVFNFSRIKDPANGKYAFSVVVQTESKTVDIEGTPTDINVDVIFPLTAEIIGRLKKETQSLDELITEISVEQIQDIVTRGVAAVDEIFEINKKKADPTPNEGVQNTGGEETRETPANGESDGRTPEQIAADNAQKVVAEAQALADKAVADAKALADKAVADAKAVAEAKLQADTQSGNQFGQTDTSHIPPSDGVGNETKIPPKETSAANTDYASMSDEQFQQMIKGQ